jgi:iron complex transport system permease protein
LLIAIIISLRRGLNTIDMTLLLEILFSGIEKDSSVQTILMDVRLPRTIAACLVGANLSVAGALLQAILKNPLADPYSIGISAGAGLAAYLIVLAFPSKIYLLAPAAFVAATLVAILVYSISWKNGVDSVRLILSGVAVSSFLRAISSSLALIYPDRLQGTVTFMVGGLGTVSWNQVQQLLPYTIIGLIAALLLSKQVNLLLLGDETARSLGVHVEGLRFACMLVATLLTAASVSVAGLLGFVGLIVPHIVRLVEGNDYRKLIPHSILLGSSFLLLSDTFGRVAFAPIEIPVGIIMALLGAPFFLYILRRRQK